MKAELSIRDPDFVPLVSIIMGAYNAEDTIRESIDSILQQDFKLWEFVICDDGSEDATLQICREYEEAFPGYFKVLSNERNLKLPATLNRCLSVAQGKYIARMDADDRVATNRISKQLDILENNHQLDLVGTAMQRFDGLELGSQVVPPEFPDRNTLRRSTPFCHATILARREVYEVIGGYNDSPRTVRSEDRELWFDFYHHNFNGMNILEPLYFVREDKAAIRRRKAKVRWNSFLTTVIGYRKLGYPLYCYMFPLFKLSKVLVPYWAQDLYRRLQSHLFEAKR